MAYMRPENSQTVHGIWPLLCPSILLRPQSFGRQTAISGVLTTVTIGFSVAHTTDNTPHFSPPFQVVGDVNQTIRNRQQKLNKIPDPINWR